MVLRKKWKYYEEKCTQNRNLKYPGKMTTDLISDNYIWIIFLNYIKILLGT